MTSMGPGNLGILSILTNSWPEIHVDIVKKNYKLCVHPLHTSVHHETRIELILIYTDMILPHCMIVRNNQNQKLHKNCLVMSFS